MRVRMLRVLEYEGDVEDVTEAMNRRAVKGTMIMGRGDMVIREAVIGESLTILERTEKNENQSR